MGLGLYFLWAAQFGTAHIYTHLGEGTNIDTVHVSPRSITAPIAEVTTKRKDALQRGFTTAHVSILNYPEISKL